MSIDYEYVCKCGWQGADDEMDCVLAFPGTDDMPSEYTFLCPNCRYVEIGEMQEVEVVAPDPVNLLFDRSARVKTRISAAIQHLTGHNSIDKQDLVELMKHATRVITDLEDLI